MNPLILQNPDKGSRHSQPQIDCYSPGGQMLDGDTHSFRQFEDWVAEQLERIGHNSLPHNCSKYEALTSIVESVSQADQYNSATVCYSLEQSSPYHGNTNYEETQDDLVIHMNNEESPKNSLSLSLFSPLDYDEMLVSNDMDDLNDPLLVENDPGTEVDFPVDLASLDVNQLTQKKLISAFVKLIDFCCHEPMQFHLKHHRKPLELLLQLETMFELFSEWHSSMKRFVSLLGTDQQQKMKPSINTDDIQTKLANILFGENIPITNKLLFSWTMISLWVNQGHQVLNTNDKIKLRQHQQSSEKWIRFGVSSYSIAKRTCGIIKSNSSRQISIKP